MQKIKVLISDSNVAYSFNPNVYVDSLKHLSDHIDIEPIDDVNAWFTADLLQSYIRDKQLFTADAKDVFMIRQLLSTGYFRIDQTQPEGQDIDVNASMRAEPIRKQKEISEDLIKIRIDKIAIGTQFNIPANKDIEVKKITNQPYYNFTIDQSSNGIKRLLAQSEKLYDVLLVKSYVDVPKLTSVKSNISYETIPLNETPNPFANLGDVNKYLMVNYSAKSSPLLSVFIAQLQSAGSIEILRELITGNNQGIKNIINGNKIAFLNKQRKYEDAKKVYESLNMFNRLYNIILKSPKSYETIIDKIKANNIFTIEKLRHFLTKDEYAKVGKFVEVVIEPPNNCTHNSDFRKFYSARNKEEYFAEYDALENKYINHDEAEHIYRCKKCNGYLFCEHDIEFAKAATVGLGIPSIEKEKLSEKYRDLSINDVHGTIFCKYCNGKLYRIQNDEIIDGSIFNALSHARSLDSNNTTELPIAKDQTYRSIKRVVGDFIFKYDFNASVLVKNIQKIILIHVLTSLANMKLNAGDDNFEVYAQLFGSVYAYIYMYDLYVKDKNIVMRNVDSGDKLNINQYAKTFAERILQQYNQIISDSKRLETIITNAYLVMKNEMRAYVDEVTDKDHVLNILSNPYYKFIHHLFSIERMVEGKPELNDADAFQHIVKVPKPNTFNFWDGAYSPKSSFWKQELYKIYAETYDLMMNFSSPSNYFQIKFDHQSDMFRFEGFEQKEFDPTLMNKMNALNQANTYELRRQLYLDLAYMPEPRDIFKAVPACFVFSNEGGKISEYKWDPVVEKGKIVDFISDKTSLFKLKCDEKLSDEIIAIISPDKRNKVIGKLPQEKKPKNLSNQAVKQRDIQFSVVKKISQNFNINQLKFIGQSSGVTMIEFMKGNVLLPIQYEVCASRLSNYVNHLIRRYNILRFNTNHTENLHYFERANLITKVNTYTEAKFPNINIDEINEYQYINQQDRYERYQEYLVDVIKLLLSTNDPIIRLFLVDEITKIFDTDKLYCIGEISNSETVAVDDDDAVGNGDDAQEIVADENDDDFVDTDNIDYEMDEDEIHDSA